MKELAAIFICVTFGYNLGAGTINIIQESKCARAGGVLIQTSGLNACVKLERIKDWK